MLFKIKHLVKLTHNIRNYSVYNKKPPWNVLFFGTDEFSIYSLKVLCNEFKNGKLFNKFEVVTNVKGKPNPVRKFAEEQKLKIHNWPISIADSYDLGLVVSFGHLIPHSVIEKFPLGILNVHASLLPRWRGAAPIIYALANGDKTTGVTIMKIKPDKFDVGDILMQSSVAISDDMRMPELHRMLGHLGAENLLKVVQDLPESLKDSRVQPNEGVTLAPKVTADFGRVKWTSMSAKEIFNLERSLTGLLNLTTSWPNNVQVKLVNVELCDNVSKNNNANLKPGFVMYDKMHRKLRVLCADNSWIFVEKIGVAGKRVMSAADFNNGFVKKEPESGRIFK